MTLEEMKQWVEYVKSKDENWPSMLDDEDSIMHWTGRLYVGMELFKKYKEYDGAYKILKELHLANEIRYSSEYFGSYEEYIEEKVNFFIEMAELSYIVTKEAAQSIPYVDEALIMLDGSESVTPYVDAKEINKIKEDYIEKAQNE
ncbi:MAG: hypothetical protein GX366_07625 [Epulopiscium sp.]|nr:hypothetical protein [Candidatus Epulonipiscium sp.]